MENEVKLKFGAVDNITPELKKMGPAMQETLKKAFSEGEKFTENAKDLLKYAKDRLAVEQQLKQAALKDKIAQAPSDFKKQIEELENKRKEIKELMLKATPGSEERKEYEKQYKGVKEEKKELPKTQEKEIKKWEEELKESKAQNQTLKLIWLTLEMNARKELMADEKNAKELVEKFEKGKYNPETAEEKIKLLNQAALLRGKEKKESSTWGDIKKVAMGVIIGEGVVGLVKSVINMPGHAVKGVLGIRGGEEAPAAMLKSLENVSIFGFNIGFGAGIASDALRRHMEEKEKAEKAGNRIRGTLGGYGGYITAPGYGMDVDEATAIAESYIKTRGTGRAGKGYAEETMDVIALMKGFNLSKESVLGGVKLSRYGGENDQEILKNTVRLVSLLRSSGALAKIDGLYDNTKVEEWIQALTDLGNTQLQTLEKIDQSKNIQILSAFSSIWSDPKQASARMSTMNQSLMTPKNDYQKAMNFAILASNKPGASLFELMEEQEKGIGAPGLLQGRMDLLRKMYGSGDMFKLATMNTFGLKAEQTRTLTEGYLANPEVFDYSKYVDQGKFKKHMLEANTSELETQMATLSDAYIKGAFAGLEETLDQAIYSLGKSLKEAFNDMEHMIKSSF